MSMLLLIGDSIGREIIRPPFRLVEDRGDSWLLADVGAAEDESVELVDTFGGAATSFRDTGDCRVTDTSKESPR